MLFSALVLTAVGLSALFVLIIVISLIGRWWNYCCCQEFRNAENELPFQRKKKTREDRSVSFYQHQAPSGPPRVPMVRKSTSEPPPMRFIASPRYRTTVVIGDPTSSGTGSNMATSRWIISGASSTARHVGNEPEMTSQLYGCDGHLVSGSDDVNAGDSLLTTVFGKETLPKKVVQADASLSAPPPPPPPPAPPLVQQQLVGSYHRPPETNSKPQKQLADVMIGTSKVSGANLQPKALIRQPEAEVTAKQNGDGVAEERKESDAVDVGKSGRSEMPMVIDATMIANAILTRKAILDCNPLGNAAKPVRH